MFSRDKIVIYCPGCAGFLGMSPDKMAVGLQRETNSLVQKGSVSVASSSVQCINYSSSQRLDT